MRFSLSTEAHLENGANRDEPKSFCYKFKRRDRTRLLCLTVSLPLFFLAWSTWFPRWKTVNEEVPVNLVPVDYLSSPVPVDLLSPPVPADISTSPVTMPVPAPAPTPAALDLLDPLASLNGPPTASLWGSRLSFMFYPSNSSLDRQPSK
jgi:hypothetical protein